MLVQEADIRFKVALDKLDTSAYPELTPEVIDVIFRINEEHFIKTRYSGNNLFRTGFEVSQKRIDDLRTLVKQVTLPSIEVADSLPYYTFDITSIPDYWIYLKSEAGLRIRNCGIQYGSTINGPNDTTQFYPGSVQVRQIDDIQKLQKDPFNKSDKDEVSIVFETEGRIRAYTSGNFSVRQLTLTYLKAPLLIDHNAIGVNDPVGYTNQFNTPIETHQEIIYMAAAWTLENIESVRVRTNPNELSKTE